MISWRNTNTDPHIKTQKKNNQNKEAKRKRMEDC